MIKLKNNSEVDIRRLRGSDFEAVRDFLRLFSTETIFTNQYPGQPDIERDKSVAAYENKDNLFLGAFLPDGRLIGMTSFQKPKPNHPWSGGNAGFGLCILKEFYHCGLGTELMRQLEAGAREKGVHRLFGTVRTENYHAIHLYLKCGFTIEGITKETAFINGRWHDEYYISKLLKEEK